MVTDNIRGVMVPILTPLTPEEQVDKDSLRRLLDYLIGAGVHGIWAAGTTGEFAALTGDQQVGLIETVVEEVAGRVPVIGNISAPSTKLTVNIGQAVRQIGLDGVAATPPYYYPCAQDEILDHYRYINDQVGIPLWVYNIPITVKSVVEPQTIAHLAAEGTVVGVKDSSGAGERFAQLNVLCDQDGIEIYRFLGTMYRVTSTRLVGGHGVIPGIANLIPAIMAKAWEAGERGDEKVARKLNAQILEASKIMYLARGGGPNAASFSGMKSALKSMGIINCDTVSRPLRSLTSEEREPIISIIKCLGIGE